MSRGNRRQEIYLDDVDRQDFLKTFAEACAKTGWPVLRSGTAEGEQVQKVGVGGRIYPTASILINIPLPFAGSVEAETT